MEDKKFSKIKLNHKIWLEDQEGNSILGDGKWMLLKTIEQEGSFVGAVEKLGLSYRKTWNNLKKIEKTLGVQLLDTTRGGANGGKSELTDEAKNIIKAFDNFHKKMDSVIKKAFDEFYNKINS